MKKEETKYIFVTGGTISGIGKGIAVASISLLLKSRGFQVLPIKADPYLNKDAGTMNPYQHGEVFVTDDGAETDLDLGHYERFTGLNLDQDSNFTSGAVYAEVMRQERRGDFLGKTIQIIPHVTNEIRRRFVDGGQRKKAEIVVGEIGGTVGDIEAESFLEAARQILGEFGPGRVVFVHVVKMDYVFPSDEEKTKPIQQSVMLLRQRGLYPDFLIVRCKRPLTKDDREKISLFTNVPLAHVIEALDVSTTIYEVPANFKKMKLDDLLIKRLHLKPKQTDLKEWREELEKVKEIKETLPIALVGKYTDNDDAYLSVKEAIRHAAFALGAKPEIIFLDAEKDDLEKELRKVKALVVPGGFGYRGVEGKIRAIKFARENNLPFLGLCLGLQLAVVEFSRNVLKLKKANSTEFDPKTPSPVIALLPSQLGVTEMGGTMRLGSMEAKLAPNSLAARLYNKHVIKERHRHRFEVNPKYHAALKKKGLVISGVHLKDQRLAEFVELPNHRFFIGTQAHPEFKSRFLEPHPLFLGLIAAAKIR
ncbi:MAG: CTP synthase [bacterium]|nr:CTP synthase [bacterium]